MSDNKKVATTEVKQPIQAHNASIKQLLNSPEMQKKIKDQLGKRSTQFITSVLSLVGADQSLAEADSISLLNACMTAASLDLPINKNLGFAHIIAYKNNKTGTIDAQFQLGWRGFVQLAQRSGQYKTISATEVYEGQLIEENPLTGNKYDWKSRKSDNIVGFVAYFELLNGFSKDLYMSIDEVKAHGLRYSQTFKRGFGVWKDNFEAMALKTVIKMIISKFGPMSVEMQKAMEVDQAVIKDDGAVFVDNEMAIFELPQDTIQDIGDAKDKTQLQAILNGLSPELKKKATPLVVARYEELEK